MAFERRLGKASQKPPSKSDVRQLRQQLDQSAVGRAFTIAVEKANGRYQIVVFSEDDKGILGVPSEFKGYQLRVQSTERPSLHTRRFR